MKSTKISNGGIRETEVVADGESESDGPGTGHFVMRRITVLAKIFHEPLEE
jgi:hypothetical protein